MPLLPQSNRKNTFDLQIKIDGILIDSWSELTYVAKVNSARAISFIAHGHVPQEALQLGSIIEVKAGIGIHAPTTDLLYFKGIIKTLRPSFDKVGITAVDYITHLATSEYINYKIEDSHGHDLYYLAANAADYKDIDISGLTAGASIIANKDTINSQLTGLMTRKEFIDSCFNNMTVSKRTADYPANTFLKWKYAIRSGTVLDFFLPDAADTTATPVFTFNKDNNNISQSMVGSVDTTKIVNSATFVSSSDKSIFETYTDTSSVNTFGVSSRLITFDTTRRDRLEQLAYQYVEQNKFPTISYTIQINTLETINLGDIVKIEVPSLERSDILPVEEYSLFLGEGIKATYTLGEKRLTTNQILNLI